MKSDTKLNKLELPELTPELLKPERPSPIRADKLGMSMVFKTVEEEGPDEVHTLICETDNTIYLETVEEGVEVGPTFCSQFVIEDEDDIPLVRKHSKSFTEPNQYSLRTLSIKNPHRSSGTVEIPTTLKRFLAPRSIELKLVLEQGPPKVLLVEDNDFDRMVMAKCIFEVCNWEPDLAKDGDEAIRLYKAYASQGFMYKCICMDVTLPRKDGYATAKAIREIEQEESNEPTFILGLFKEFDGSAREKCMQFGMNCASIKTYAEVKASLLELVLGMADYT